MTAAMIASGVVPASLALAADVSGIATVSVLERGIYAAVDEGRPIARGSLGPVSSVAHVSLIESTELIPGRRTLRFGLRYVVEGPARGRSVDLKLVTRFPDAGLLDPATGVRHTASEYTIATRIGIAAYREFQFHQPWEIVPGQWTFEFWVADRKIGSQQFCVVDEIAEGSVIRPSASRQCIVLSAAIKEAAQSSLRSLH
jgi:hypothetical protein